MAGQNTVDGDLYVRGNLIAQTMGIPAASIVDAQIAANAGIGAAKAIHQFPLQYNQPGTVAAQTMPIHIVHGATGTVAAFKVAVQALPQAGTQFTVDLQKSTGGGAYASILSAAVTIDSTKTVRTVYSGTLTSTALVAGDLLQIVVAVSGAGTQAVGMVAEVVLQEAPV